MYNLGAENIMVTSVVSFVFGKYAFIILVVQLLFFFLRELEEPQLLHTDNYSYCGKLNK
jgi:hypothetical protein